MPKLRQTCTRCSMRRQKCDRKSPCSRCIQNKEAHLCTREWGNYNPSIHRKYPKKDTPVGAGDQRISSGPPCGFSNWPTTPISDQDQSQDAAQRPVPEPREEGTGPSIDFIGYGRSDYNDISIGSLLASKDAHDQNKMLQGLNQSQHRHFEDSSASSDAFTPPARAAALHHLQSLLPSKSQAMQMLDYHDKYMCYWVGGIYHAPSFKKSLVEAYGQSSMLELQDLDWRWTALLFSILSASIIGSPNSVSAMWGFLDSEKVRLSKAWGRATVDCLILGDFASKFHMYSLQAILTMHTSEHLVGSTKEFTVYQGAAIVIARGLGLHRLGPHDDDGNSATLCTERRAAFIQREIGRRIWYALSSQDWLCSTSTGTYSIQPKHFTTIMPGYFDEETLVPASDDTPTYTRSTNYLNRIALVLIQFYDALLDARDLEAQYRTILDFDSKMRATYSEELPRFLDPRTPLNPVWPRWVAWARRLHETSNAHKLIMIHQSFLGRSFKSAKYTYSRWACATASKSIIDAMTADRDDVEPQWWVEQAFLVTAGISLTLDLFNRSDNDSESRELKTYIEKTIQILQSYHNSALASHGIRLLTSLINERGKRNDNTRGNLGPSTVVQEAESNISNPLAMAHASTDANQAQLPLATHNATGPLIVDDWFSGLQKVDPIAFEDFMEVFPMEGGLDGNNFFENMLNAANIELL